ncbi:hypothetical protein MJO28_007351 [Puccinia striiformis f. sp. tritici]|uniref:Uncharacterized protein n=1 Tax=Puccinia striiformis f. sp. tritici TaxID=168172 RepID=A0ACC0EFQ7_9BASI|nr:hypothetical protein Pst134EB_014446 [Puccinia striiformis f. sp. tritici]KAI7951667.1 hypothetical protein MJO28_007351 [Puccinia striiformis f. sp. tritici]KAI9607670.1 hypothetical protein KEM48_003580 [Puccinia striiformis f. sp. tritici PST-130]
MTNKNDTRIGVLLSTTNKRKPVQKLLGYFISFLVFYYSILVFIKNRNHQSSAVTTSPTTTTDDGFERKWRIEYGWFTLAVLPVVLSLISFGSICLCKILLDISISNQSNIHEQSYHELLSDIQMAKEDLRNKGISVD